MNRILMMDPIIYSRYASTYIFDNLSDEMVNWVYDKLHESALDNKNNTYEEKDYAIAGEQYFCRKVLIIKNIYDKKSVKAFYHMPDFLYDQILWKLEENAIDEDNPLPVTIEQRDIDSLTNHPEIIKVSILEEETYKMINPNELYQY